LNISEDTKAISIITALSTKGPKHNTMSRKDWFWNKVSIIKDNFFYK